MPKDTIRLLRVKDMPNFELFQTNDVARYVPRHVHLVFSLSVAEAGLRIHETKAGKYYVTPGSIVVVNVGETHASRTPDGYKCSSRSIRIDPLTLNTLAMQLTGREHDVVHLLQPVISDPELSRQIFKLHKVFGDSVPKLEKECLLLDVFAKLYARHARERMKPVSPGHERIPVSRVCEYLQDCYNENVSLDKLAAIAGLSAFHLSRVFAGQIGVPPHTYQLQIRLKKATDLLALGRPIAEVAYETGFCDQSHFQKAFKKKFGLTPGQYGC